MSIQIKVPPVGESITEVTISQWLKKDGEHVERDEVLCELESDKATFELNAESAGTLKVKVKEGETIEVGTLIAEIDENGAAEAAPEKAKPATTPAPSSAKAETVEMKVPPVGESITEVTIGSWFKKAGELVQAEETLCEIESDKATFELAAEATGVFTPLAKEGETAKIGDVIGKIEVREGQSAPKVAASSSAPAAVAEQKTNYAEGVPSPAASKIMAERGLSADQVQGTGKDGRITKEDALAAKKAPAETKPAASTPAPAPVSGQRTQRREKMSSLRKTVSKRLVAVKNQTAMLTTFNEVDMKPIMNVRSKYKETFKEKFGVGLGFMSFFTKACTQALKEFPAVNAYIDGEELIYNDYCDISIAVSAPKGLVVPVIRNAESLSFDQVEKEVVRLAGKARDNKLSIEEMTGGTFTITNGGVFGSMLSTPIINAPQSAILGMHNIVQRPVALDGQVVIRPIMYVALSYDHRIIDGRESVGFLVRVKQLLEDPARLMLGV